MMLPAAAARLWTPDITRGLLIAGAFGLVSSYLGLVISFQSSTPSGPLIILVAGVIYLASLVLGPAGGVVRLIRPRRHLEA